MTLDNDQGGPPVQNGASPGPAQGPKEAAKKPSRPGADVKRSSSSLELPNGCTLSAEVDILVTDLEITQRRDEGEKGEVRLRNLGKSMKLIGQLCPAIVGPKGPSSKHPVFAGNRRTAAARLEEIRTLRCRIFQGPDAAIPHVISAVENAHREQEGPWSLAQKLAAALKEGFDQKRLAEMFQKSKGAVSDMLYAVTRLPAAYRRRIEKGENLYKVVAEHRRTKKQAAVITPEEAAKEATTQDALTVSELPGAPECAGLVEPPVAPPTAPLAAKPQARYQYGRFECEGFTVTVTGTSKEKPSAADLVAALRRVLSHYEATERGGQG
jgi:ParB/RepB/Spo0J family partition protein